MFVALFYTIYIDSVIAQLSNIIIVMLYALTYYMSNNMLTIMILILLPSNYRIGMLLYQNFETI